MKTCVMNLMYPVMNEEIKSSVKGLEDIHFHNKLDSLLENKGLSQKEFSQLCGLREATISNFINNKKLNINIGHLVIMMTTLGITNLTDIIDIEF